MRQRHDPAPSAIVVNLAPPPHHVGNSTRRQLSIQARLLRVLSNQDNQFDIWQSLEDQRVPGFRAFPSRGKVAALSVVSGKAKSHGDERDRPRVVECRLPKPEPSAKARARRVRERPAGEMSARARRLSYDADPRGRRRLKDRPGCVRQGRSVARRVAAQGATAHPLEQAIKFRRQMQAPMITTIVPMAACAAHCLKAAWQSGGLARRSGYFRGTRTMITNGHESFDRVATETKTGACRKSNVDRGSP
jgi:hypothetical protein